MKYQDKLSKLNNRRNDPQFLQKSLNAESASRILNEGYKKTSYPDSVKYTLGAMAEVDNAYTKNTIEEGNRIKNQLDALNRENFLVSFKFQGSTTNNTHIKAHSDIDLLVLQEKFQFSSQPSSIPYIGDWKQEQISLRSACMRILKNVFYTANVDNSGTYAINITGGSLIRKIDVVPSCWNIDQKYYSNPIPDNKGIRVYDKLCTTWNINYPFINNNLIEKKDTGTQDNFRKAVRLLKTLKADSDRNLTISSYDIVSLLYNIDNEMYNIGNHYLLLVRNIKNYLLALCNHPLTFSALDVPDGTRKIADKVTMDELRGITVEIGELENDLVQDLASVYKRIDETINVEMRRV